MVTRPYEKSSKGMKDGKGFTQNTKPEFKPKGSSIKATSHRRGQR